MKICTALRILYYTCSLPRDAIMALILMLLALLQEMVKCMPNDNTMNIHQLISTMAAMRERLDRLEESPSNNPSSGTTYTRFGSHNCPSAESELVYAGIAGGSHYTYRGGAVDYLCLPEDPDWYQTTDGNQILSAHVFGSEFETDFPNSPFGSSHQNYGVPCAVCRTLGRASKYMVPGKNQCAQGWTLEYSGYLMTGYPEHLAASEYVCVDKNANVTGSNTDLGGKLFYSVEAQCGSLPCPPYVQGWELTCAVCTK